MEGGLLCKTWLATVEHQRLQELSGRMAPTKDATFSVAQNPRGSSVAFSSLQMRLWVVVVKVEVVQGQHLVEGLVLEAEETLEALSMPQCASVDR